MRVNRANAASPRPTIANIPAMSFVSHHLFMVKKTGTRTRPFFAVCFGRAERRSPRTTVRYVRRGGAVAVVMGG